MCIGVVCNCTLRDICCNYYDLFAFLYIFETNIGAGIWTNGGVSCRYCGLKPSGNLSVRVVCPRDHSIGYPINFVLVSYVGFVIAW